MSTNNVLSGNSAIAQKKRTMDGILSHEFAGLEVWAPVKTATENSPQVFDIHYIKKQWLQKDFKILMYVDSAGCSDCRLNLSSWKYLMEEADSLFDGQVGFLLYFQPKSEREMVYLLARERFEYPVFMDINGVINRQNRFPSDMRFQCFLLDGDNRVLMIGNPVLNADVWELYKTQVSNLINRKLTELQIFVKIDTQKESVDFENFAHQGSISTLHTLNRIARGRVTEVVSLLEFVAYFPEMAGEILQTASLDSYIAPLATIVTGSTQNRRKTLMIFEMEDGVT